MTIGETISVRKSNMEIFHSQAETVTTLTIIVENLTIDINILIESLLTKKRAKIIKGPANLRGNESRKSNERDKSWSKYSKFLLNLV